MMKIIFATLNIALLLTTNTAHSEPSTLKTQAGSSFGFSISSYQYEEPGIMSNEGGKLGLDLHTAKILQYDQFIRGDFRYAFGKVDYNSNDTGSASGELDWYIEARGLFGKDWRIKNAVFTAYTGLGFRFLFNDARGISSTGNWGYRRESNYLYVPIGIIHRLIIKNQARLVSTLEYDHLLQGKQISRLSDGRQGHSDLTNNQNSGYGLKLSFSYEKDNWVVGPYAEYWDIDDSDFALVFQNGTPIGLGWEPKNNTIEFGLKVGQRF